MVNRIEVFYSVSSETFLWVLSDFGHAVFILNSCLTAYGPTCQEWTDKFVTIL